MAVPLIKRALWARGKYDVFIMTSECGFCGYMCHPGFAFAVDQSQDKVVSDHQIFLSTRGGRCKGVYFICATSPRPFHTIKPGTTFDSTLINVLGVQQQYHPPLIKKRLAIRYREWKGHLCGFRSLTEVFSHHSNPRDFVKAMFHPDLLSAYIGQIYIRPLNQISGPTIFQRLNLGPAFVIRDGQKWYEVQGGGDRWSGGWYHASDKYQNIIRAPAEIRNVPGITVSHCGDMLGLSSGCRQIRQFNSGKTLVIFSLIRYRDWNDPGFIWQPLPNSPPGYQDFVLLYEGQKQKIDSDIRELGPDAEVESSDFRGDVEEYGVRNTGYAHIRVPLLTYGDHFFHNEIVNFVVSVIQEDEVHEVQSQGAMQMSDTIWAQVKDQNQHDCYYPGVVVSRFSQFPKEDILDDGRLQLVNETFPNKGLNRGFFQMGGFQMGRYRQSNRSNTSMGVVSPPVNHDYFDERQMETSLLPFVNAILEVLFEQAVHTQELSGQVIMGVIKSAIKTLCDQETLSKWICAHLILSHPILDEFGNPIPYFNSDHLDNDHTCAFITHLVMTYVEEHCGELIQNYFKRIERLIRNRPTKSGKPTKHHVPLPTTCPWKLVEKPEDSGWGLLQYFVMTEAGVAWNLSSSVFMREIDILCGTFFGSLCSHVTSAPLWINLKTGGVTTISPGIQALLAWGSSGGYAYTRATGTQRDALIVNHIRNYMRNHGGSTPRRLPGVPLDQYIARGRRPNQVSVRAPVRDAEGELV